MIEPGWSRSDEPLRWVHFGDLHLIGREADNHRDLRRLVEAANAAFAGTVDFCFLPGDLAEHGRPEQYALLTEALAELQLPWRAIPGDHDREPGSLDAFYAATGHLHLPRAIEIRGHCCVFLDMVSAGGGGPDFRLGLAQLAWLGHTLQAAHGRDQDSIVFMHGYPADLADPAEAAAVRRLFAEHAVVCVDMGHTHYNELANDGRTIYAATRSVGQAEEGPVGFSVVSVDGGGVAWRFRSLGEPWPLVMATMPVDRRLLTHADGLPQDGRRVQPVGALAWSDTPVLGCACRIDEGAWQALDRGGDGAFWTGSIRIPDAARRLTVRATDARGALDEHRIELPGPDFVPPPRAADGSDADRIGAWAEHGILGTQLGPNRNGRRW